MHFFYPCSKYLFKGWGWNFSWSFGKVLRTKSMKMVFDASIIYHKLCMIYRFFDFLLKNYLFIAKINLNTQVPFHSLVVINRFTLLELIFIFSIVLIFSFSFNLDDMSIKLWDWDKKWQNIQVCNYYDISKN